MTRPLLFLVLPAIALAGPPTPVTDNDQDVSNASYPTVDQARQNTAKPGPSVPAAPATRTEQDVTGQAFPAKQPGQTPTPTPTPATAPTAPATPPPPAAAPTPAPIPAAPVTAKQLLGPRTFTLHYDFKQESLDSVITLLIKDFHYPIVLNADPATPITGVYSASSLEGVLRLVCADANLRYERRQGQIYVTSTSKQHLSRISLADLQHLSVTPEASESESLQIAGGQAVAEISPEMATKRVPPNISSQNATPESTPTKPSGNLLSKLFGTSDNFKQIAERRAKLLSERTVLLASQP
jgi:hypothetical protein